MDNTAGRVTEKNQFMEIIFDISFIVLKVIFGNML